ncbi:JAB domain-containing protein [Escherichia coli]|uniref:JAB domain-containing protein n=1 Tax=Escherichia coli TaxID=562 RepID=UPI00254E3DB6|nr:JAB domain-containing protein [Escherichia coli]
MQQLSFLPGEMTPGERSLIQRALKTLDRHLREPGVAFTSTRAAREWLILNMAGLEREEFRVLYLNNQNQLIAGETLFTGTRHCCKVSDEAAFCLIQRPYISKTLLTRRISPRGSP